MSEQVSTPFGKIAKYQDCNWCKKKLACRFDRVAYSQPCDSCKATKRYDDELAQQDRFKHGSITSAFKAQQAAAVWEHKGRNIYTNDKGDIIKDEPYKPLTTGKRDKPKKSFA